MHFQKYRASQIRLTDRWSVGAGTADRPEIHHGEKTRMTDIVIAIALAILLLNTDRITVQIKNIGLGRQQKR